MALPLASFLGELFVREMLPQRQGLYCCHPEGGHGYAIGSFHLRDTRCHSGRASVALQTAESEREELLSHLHRAISMLTDKQNQRQE